MIRSVRTATAALAVAALLAGVPADARAQVSWDSPMLMAPGSPAGWGVHLVDPHPGDGLGALVTWRGAPAPVGLGFRLGLFDSDRSDLGIAGGVDVAGTLHRGDDDAPFDVIWFSGVGIGVDDDLLLSVPLGVAAGWTFTGSDAVFRPYVAPRMVLDALFDDDDDRPGRRDDDDLDLDAALEIGADLAFSPSFAIRAAASFGGRDAVSIGVAFPGR